MTAEPANRWWWTIVGAAVALVIGGAAAAMLTDVSNPIGPLVAGIAAAAAALLVGLLRARQRDEPVSQPREPSGHLGYPCACTDESRRRLIRGGAVAAVVAAAAAGVPLWRATRRAEAQLRDTGWHAGSRMVDDQGSLVRVGSLVPGAFVTVWPEDGAERDDSQVVLIRLLPGREVVGPGRDDWVVDGHVAYSKLCTHMGCPVGLYQSHADLLVCPCHQATFDVLRGATPVHGPTKRALPQLPLAVDDDGFLVATDDFPDTVGPAYWSRPS